MVYINSRGEIVDKPPFSWLNPVSVVLAFLNFIYIFFQTMFNPDLTAKGDKKKRVGGFGSGFGPSPPPPPARGG